MQDQRRLHGAVWKVCFVVAIPKTQVCRERCHEDSAFVNLHSTKNQVWVCIHVSVIYNLSGERVSIATGVISLIGVGWLEPRCAGINLTWGSEAFKNRNHRISVRTWNLSQSRKQELQNLILTWVRLLDEREICVCREVINCQGAKLSRGKSKTKCLLNKACFEKWQNRLFFDKYNMQDCFDTIWKLNMCYNHSFRYTWLNKTTEMQFILTLISISLF